MTTSTDKSYFDLHITGLGYLNRIREVKPKKGDAFLACDIAALNGPSDDVGYVRFDTRVSGSEAQHLVRRCIQAVDAEKKVMIGFRLGDLWADTFTYSKGKRAGEQGVSLKARLLFVSWIKVDGKLAYKAEPKPTDADDRDERDARNTDVPATSAEPQAAASEPARPAAEAADEAAADAPALEVAESF
ncbi:STY4534 family ICE replication protein [Pseudomonas aeruginosa]